MDLLQLIEEYCKVDIPKKKIKLPLQINIDLRLVKVDNSISFDSYYISLGDNCISSLILSKEDAKRKYTKFKSAFENGNYRLTISTDLRVSIEILDN